MTYGILIDTVSIQDYIFSSNHLKENLGASLLVQNIFKHQLADAIEETFELKLDLNAWRTQGERSDLDHLPIEIGYIGGGNVFLLTSQQEDAVNLVRSFTRMLLLQTPGIKTAVAIEPFDLNKFASSRQHLFQSLKHNRQAHIPQTHLNPFGFTAECKRTGLSAEVWQDLPEGGGEYISCVAKPRLEATKDLSTLLGDDIHEMLGEQWEFTSELDKLGQHEGKDSHIAIVHIDGNSMGDRFSAVSSLGQMRALADSVETATKEAFKTMLKQLIKQLEPDLNKETLSETDYLGLKPTKGRSGKFVLPMRPLILGGDDITFVCNGSLGIYLAKTYMETFEQVQVSDQKSLNACAGIAIIKTKYPFYKGYTLSEALCKNAKQVRKAQNDTGSWLDFHWVQSTTTDTLEAVRKTHYNTQQGSLLMRPYKLNSQSKDLNSFTLALSKTDELLSKWPNNKRKALRDILSADASEQTQFLNSLSYRKLELPKYDEGLANDLFTPGTSAQTPYFDLLELIELYPSALLSKQGVTV